jgi:hypothetical protein
LPRHKCALAATYPQLIYDLGNHFGLLPENDCPLAGQAPASMIEICHQEDKKMKAGEARLTK